MLNFPKSRRRCAKCTANPYFAWGGQLSNRYTFGRFQVRPDERQLLVDGKPAALGARALDLLLCLIELRDRVVGKDELMQRVWPGVVVEENNLTVQISALRKLLGPQAVATIARRGYRFTLPDSETSIAASPQSSSKIAPTAGEIDLSLPGKPSIAVLPFANLSGDAEQEYFTDSITEDIITELSRFHSLFVIARNSSFTYKGKAVDVRTVAQELGIRYVVEGSIRKTSNHIRVTGKLIDALTGNNIWAEKYDRELEDIFAVQEEITRSIVTSIAPQIETFEAARMRTTQPGNLSAYELGVRGWAAAVAAYGEADRTSRDKALRLAREALAIDPRCCAALRTVGFAQWQNIFFHTTESASDALDEGIGATTRAITIDNGDHFAHLWKGMLLFQSGQQNTGLAHMRRSHELNPNDSLTLLCLGYCESSSGDPQKGIEYCANALRLSPRDPWHYNILNVLGWAYFAAGDYANGAELAQRSVSEAPNLPNPRGCLVVSLIGLGELVRAKSEFQMFRDLAPEFVEARLAGQWLSTSPEFRQRATTFLRIAAGLEDPSMADALR